MPPKGSKHSAESIAKMRLVQSNKPYKLIGHKHSEESKKKMAKARKKPIKFIKDSNGCYICTSHVPNHYGYPTLNVNGKRLMMSRYLYSLKNGPIPDGLWVCHKCDNPLCINIKHLFISTPEGNTNDMCTKKRNQFGEKTYNHKLTEKEVMEIRMLPIVYGDVPIIAKKYGVSRSRIDSIRKRKSWKHI